MISMAIGYEPAKAYHAYTALFYCVGIAGGWPRAPRLCCRRRTCCSKISGPMEPAFAAVALGCGSRAAAPTNPLVANAQWEDTLDPAAGPGILWMQCRGGGRCLRVRPWFARAL